MVNFEVGQEWLLGADGLESVLGGSVGRNGSPFTGLVIRQKRFPT